LKVVATLRTTADRAAQPATPAPRRRLRGLGLAALVLLLAPASGCGNLYGTFLPAGWGPPQKAKDAPPGAVDGLMLSGGAPEPEVLPASGTAGAELEGGKQLVRDTKYAEAEPVFNRLAGNPKNTVQVVEESVFYWAECERLQGRYPNAAALYIKLLNAYPSGKHSRPARERLFDIANYWLDDTRVYMEACREKKEGKRWWVWPMAPLRFDKTKPTFDIEGHAVRALEQVYITEPRGPLAEKALFYLGSVKFFREDYREADHYFDQLQKFHPDGKMAAEALRYSIICKQMSTGGSEYDGRVLAEARDKLAIAQVSYPELAKDNNQFFEKQLFSITQQQADSDFKVAEFYRRIGRPGSAYFYYELVRRRYSGTAYAEKAALRMAELKQKVDQEKAQENVQAPPPQQSPQGGQPPQVGPAPQTYVPGTPLETGPVPRTLPPSLEPERRGP
jgi:TolA-binding protein